ncbi:MAG: VWA domain-containing protein [Chlamydiota bacterium]
MMFDIEIDNNSFWTAIGITFVIIASWFYLKKWKKPFIYYSRLGYFLSDQKSFRQYFTFLPTYLMGIALVSFLIAFIDPHYYTLKKDSEGDIRDPMRIPTEGIAIYLVLDNSRSMSEELELSTSSGRRKKVTKMEILKDVTERFVRGDSGESLKGRPNDLIGVVSFARSAQVLAPLTLDHREIIENLRALKVNHDESQLGTAIGYAIFKTANLIKATQHFGQDVVQDGKPAYEIKNSVILLVTDGFQETNPEDYQNPLRSIDLVDATNFAKEYGITLYIVNIDPKINSERYNDHRQYFELLTDLTGGKFYYVDTSRNLQDIYAEIDKLEKSELPEHTRDFKENLPHIYKRVSFYRPLIFLGLVSIFLSGLLTTTVLRRFP